MGMTTMKTNSPRIFGAVVGLCVLSVMVCGAGGDDATDYANQLAQAQKEREEWQAQREQAQRDFDQRQRDAQALQDWHNRLYQAQKEREQWQADRERAQKEWDDWHRQLDQAQRERDDYQKNLDYQQSILDGIERVRRQHDELLSRGQEAPGGGATVPPQEAQAVRQQGLMIENPFALKRMDRENRERVHQQIMHTRQQMMPGSQKLPLLIQNPFVHSSR
jgi:chromosome segregation ATPase